MFLTEKLQEKIENVKPENVNVKIATPNVPDVEIRIAEIKKQLSKSSTPENEEGKENKRVNQEYLECQKGFQQMLAKENFLLKKELELAKKEAETVRDQYNILMERYKNADTKIQHLQSEIQRITEENFKLKREYLLTIAQDSAV